MGNTFLLAVLIGAPVGALSGAGLLYLLSDEMRWQRFLEALTGWMDNRASRWAFGKTIGRWVNLKTIASYARSGSFDKVQAVAVREGLIDEAVGILSGFGFAREAAVLARKTGRDARAEAMFRGVIDGALAAGNRVAAAEAAEEAGFWTEAVELLTASESRESRLKGARLAGEHGMPQTSVQVYLENEAVMEAMRAAEAAEQTEFLFQFCEESSNRILHHFAADASRRAGDPERGLRILVAHGHLHQAAQFAKEAGLDEQFRALRESIAERKRGMPVEPPPQPVHLKFRSTVEEAPAGKRKPPLQAVRREDEELPDKRGVGRAVM